MKSIILKFSLFVFVASLSSCIRSDNNPSRESQRPPDFLNTELQNSDDWVRPTDCRANISQVVCEVEPPKANSAEERPCKGGEEKYALLLEKIYDTLDPINQKMFCSLRIIYIEQILNATAYASTVYKKDKDGHPVHLPGAILGFKKDYLDVTPDFSIWATWKDQLNFIEIKKNLETPLKFPRFASSNNSPWFLKYVVIHEFGHMFDFANELNKVALNDKNCGVNADPGESAKCPYHFIENTWGSLSWESFETVKPEYDFWGRNLLCFYDCKTRMNPESDVLPFYQGLGNSVFVSTYAARNPMEDWAESWATHWTLENGEDFEIQASPDYGFKASEIFNSPRFANRKKMIEDFKKSEIKYP